MRRDDPYVGVEIDRHLGRPILAEWRVENLAPRPKKREVALLVALVKRHLDRRKATCRGIIDPPGDDQLGQRRVPLQSGLRRAGVDIVLLEVGIH